MTKKELSKLYYLNREIKNQRERLAELESAASGCSSNITGMPRGSITSDKVSRYAAEIADLKSIIELNIQQAWFELDRLNRYIETIDDAQIREILRLRYVDGKSWYKVAASIGGNNTEDSVKKACYRYLKKHD